MPNIEEINTVNTTATSDQSEQRSKLGRRRFLTALTGGFFGMAAKAFVPGNAQAAPTPAYCQGAPGCDTCSGTTCTGCYNGRSYNCQNISGKTCWTAQGGYYGNGCWHFYRCCDWYRSDWSVCICRGYAGVLCQAKAA